MVSGTRIKKNFWKIPIPQAAKSKNLTQPCQTWTQLDLPIKRKTIQQISSKISPCVQYAPRTPHAKFQPCKCSPADTAALPKLKTHVEGRNFNLKMSFWKHDQPRWMKYFSLISVISSSKTCKKKPLGTFKALVMKPKLSWYPFQN